MKMADMKLPKKSKKEMDAGMPVSSSQDEYPWGLRITLNEDQVKKLEHVMGYKVDDEVDLIARGKIVSMRTNDQQGGKTERTVEIQITGLSCEGNMDASKMSDEEYVKYRKAKRMRE